MGGGNHSRGWAGERGSNWKVGDFLRLRQAAAGTHDAKGGVYPTPLQSGLDPLMIRGQQRHQGRVETSGVGSFVLAILAENFRRNRNAAFGIDLGDEVADVLLVAWVTVGVEQ